MRLTRIHPPRPFSSGLRRLFDRRASKPRSANRRRGMPAVGEPHPSLQLERLEGRALLAVISTSDTQAGDISHSDPESITVDAGIMLKSTGGKITLEAPSITINAGAQLIASGAIELKARNVHFDTGISAYEMFAAIGKTNATVTIGTGVVIRGDSLTISTKAGDEGFDSIPYYGQVIDVAISKLINPVLNLPVSIQVRQPTTAIEIGSGTQIVTTGDVVMEGEAIADATGLAIWSVLEEAAQKYSRSIAFGAAAGFSYADAKATAHVDKTANITAGGKVAITTNVQSTAAMSAQVALNQGLAQTNPKNIDFAYAGAMTKATSVITVDVGANIVATKNVDIHASATDVTQVKPRTASYRDGLVGVTVGTGFTEGVVEVNVAGSITAGSVAVPEPLAFNPSLTVDFSTRSILFPGDVGFRTGDELVYSTGGGAAIPGLVDGQSYFAIVDPAEPRRLRLAATAAEAWAGLATDLGAGYPTLTTPKGTLPIVSIDAAASDTLWFGFDRWPDGTPLFANGDTVNYRALAGQYVGRNDATGHLLGALADGDYRVELVPAGSGDVGMRIRLLDANGARLHLNTNPQFVTDSGVICQVASFDPDAATVSFIGSDGGGSTVPGEFPTLTNGQRIRYVQAFGALVPGLVDGRDYYAVVDPGTPGVIQLAETLPQAVAGNPAIQNAVPSLETQESDPARRRSVAIGDVQPGTGLVFGKDPQIGDGAAVVYRAVPGKPVIGLVDGATYYAYPLLNPYFEPNFPQYVLGLRAAPDPSLPLIEYSLWQSMSAGDTDFVINGIDATARELSLALPRVAPVVSADSSRLVGGAVALAAVPADAPQVWTNATVGTFRISLPNGVARAVTAPIPFSASAAAVAEAINAAGIPGIHVTAAYGRGRYESPWTLVGDGLDDLLFDQTGLIEGEGVWSRFTAAGLEAVSTTATGGTFTLTLNVAGTSQTSAPLPAHASAIQVQAVLNAIPGMLAGEVTGTGTTDDPWLIGPRVQPLRTGDAVVFHDAWGSTSPGLLDGETYYAIVAPIGGQGQNRSVVIRLASSREAAVSSEPVPVPLSTTLPFAPAVQSVMAGTRHSLLSATRQTGINLQATLDSRDSQAASAANGKYPGKRTLVFKADFAATRIWSSDGVGKGFKERARDQVIRKLGSQGGDATNDEITASASGSGLRVTNKARVVVQSTATLSTTGSVGISSTITERVTSYVEATVSKPNKGSLGIGVAVDVVEVSCQSHAIVETGAQITGAEGVTVDAKTIYPMPVSWLSPLVGSDFNADDVTQTVKNGFAILGASAQNLLFTHYANAAVVKEKEFPLADKLAVTIAGSVSYIDIDNDTLAQIEDGALINQDHQIGGLGPVIVKAVTDVQQWGVSGNIDKPYKPGGPSAEGTTALGGSVGMLQIQNTTRALLGGLEMGAAGSPLRSPAGPLLVTAGTDGVTVDATTNVFVVQLALGGTKATNFGFSGMAAVLDANSGKQVTEAAIPGGKGGSEKAVIVSDGPVDVAANDSTYLIPVAGAIVISDSKGVGVSTSIAGLDRGVTARVGAKDDEVDAGVGLVDVQVVGDLRLAASAAGAVTPSALASSKISSSKPAGQPQNLDDFLLDVENPGNRPQGAFGLAVSGDFTWADVQDDVRATVNTRGTIAVSGDFRPTLGIEAKNTTTILALGGAAAKLTTDGDSSSASLAGSAAIIDAASTVVASVRRATVQGLVLDVSAENARQIGSVAASGTGAEQPRSGSAESVSVAVAGSVTINTITTTTRSIIEGVTGTDIGLLSSAAKTSDTIFSAAGAILARTGDGAASGKTVGVGLAFAQNAVTTFTEATVVDSLLAVRSGDVSLSAVDASRLVTIAAGVIVANAGSSLGGMFSFVTANSKVTAEIDGGSLDVETGNVDIRAMSALLIVTAAGDLAMGRGQGSSFAAGAAVASVGGTLNTTARVKRGSVRARRGNVTVSSRSVNPDNDPGVDALLANIYTPHREQTAIWTFALGVVWSKSVATADFSVGLNTLSATRSATIEDGASVRTDAGTITVRAIDEAAIYSGAGSIAWGTGDTGKVAAGAAVVRNTFAGTTAAQIDASHVAAGGTGSIEVSATGGGLIGTAAVGGEVAGTAFGTAVVTNDIDQSVAARITGTASQRANVTAAGPISVTATERSRIGAGAGQVSVATKGAGAGAAAATNTIRSTVDAIVEQSDVSSSAGAIALAADAAGEIYSYAVGVAGAFGGDNLQFAGVGSGTGNTLVRQVTAAVQAQAALASAGLSVTASDSSKIDTAAGTLAVQASSDPDISVAMGISASTNTVGSTSDDAKKKSFVRATVSDSTVTTHGAVKISATANLAIQAITAAGAGQFSGGEKPTVGIAGAGAGSGNTIQMEVTAALRNASLTQQSNDGISLTADNQTSIFALAGGVAVAGSSPGQSKGIGVTVGAAASVNTISISTAALVEGTTAITTPGNLAVAATGAGSIKAVSFGVADALRTGGSTFDLAGAGSAAINTVTTSTVAAIRSASGSAPVIGTPTQKVGSVDVAAHDTSSIVAGAGGLSSLFSFGKGSAVGLSVGVSYTINEIGGTVSASIDGASVTTAGNVTVSADYAKGEDDSTISSVTVAGAVGASAGAGILFPEAGSGSRNTVTMATSATVSGGANVQAGGSLAVSATDASVISSNAGGVGLGLVFGNKAAAVAVGAADGKNEITNTVTARIGGATVTAGKGVSVGATATPSIESVAYGVALTVAQAELSISAAGSGASALNTVHNTVEAAILSASVVATAGDVTLKALDQPKLTTRAGAGSLAVAIGDGVALAPGAVVIESGVADTVTARIGRAAGSSTDPNVAATTGTVGVEATSAASVTSIGVAVAASVAIGSATGAASGAGAHGTVTFASTIKAAIDAGEVKAALVNVAAVDSDAATQNTIGAGALAVGFVGGSIGVSLAETTATNTATATIGAAQVTATSGGITVDVRGGHSLATETVATSVAVALGGAGAGGHAKATDTSTYRATVATGARLTALNNALVVQARGSRNDAAAPDGRLEAQAHGGAGGLVAVGVVIAKATDKTRREATIGDSVDLSGVAALGLFATSSPSVHAGSIAVDVGGVAVTVNQSRVKTLGKATASTGTGVTLPLGDVRILATGSSTLDAIQTGVVGGLLAAGATQTIGKSGLTTEAVLGPGTKTDPSRTGALVVQARSSDVSAIGATSGSGGAFNGFGTSGELTDTTTTRATLLGGTIHAGTVDIGVDRFNRYDLRVDSLNITIAVGVGITQATFTADQAASDGIDRVRVGVADGTVVSALGEVTINASHRVYRTGTDATVTGVGGSVLVSGQQALSKVDVQVPATIDVGDHVAITSGTNPFTSPGGITIVPTASLQIRDATSLNNIGLLVSGGHMASSLTGGVMPTVKMGSDVTLVSHGQIAVGTSAFVASGTASTGWGRALFGGIGTYATSDVTVDQKVTIGDRATFASDGTLSITPGDEPTGGWPTSLSLAATARAADQGIIAIPAAKAWSKLTHNSSLSFGSGASVSSGGNMHLSARATEPVVDATGEAQGDYFGFYKTVVDQEAKAPTTSRVTLAGTFLAGRENKLDIVIPNDQAGGFTSTLQATPATVFGVPVADAWHYEPAFNPTQYIDGAGYSPDVASALKAGVASGEVGAIFFKPSRPIVVSGGSVSITGDTISIADAKITAQTASVSIRNESPDYVVLGNVTIANVEGGLVTFRDSRGNTVSAPQSKSLPATPTILVQMNFATGVGGSSYGPALFLAGALENLGGDVKIVNVAGSFGQTGTIAAKRIEIDTPNGVFAVDTPNAAWNAAGTPAAQVASAMVWPGGTPGRDQLNANQAVMYAINAMAAPPDAKSPDWKDAGNEDNLNDWVYGDPGADRATYVFFGGSTPQYTNDTNTHDVNANLASGARPDGRRDAFRMTDKKPPGEKNWDHAWVPRLQKLPSTFVTSSLPSDPSDPSRPAGPAGPAVKGQVIIVNAKVANINGTLEAGGPKPGTQSVKIPKSLEANLLSYQAFYGSGLESAPIYRIPSGLLGPVSDTDRLIGASFDARTGQIILDPATSSGAGSVSIKGRIINTAALAGKIKVQGGSGDLAVTNETSLPLVTGNLQTSRSEKQAVVSITDLNVTDLDQQQIAYVYDGEQIIVYRGAAGIDLPALTAPLEHVAGPVAAFQPEPNARWQWQMDATMQRSVDLRFDESANWPGVTAGGWVFENPGREWQTVGGVGVGVIVFDANDNALVQRLEAEVIWAAGAPFPYQNAGWNTGFSANHMIAYPAEVHLTMTMSLKADWPIGIEFSGTDFGKVTVTSVGDVVVGGGMVGSTVTITASHGDVVTANGGFVVADGLSLTAETGIGTASSPLAISVERVSAVTNGGGVYLDGRQGAATTPLSLGNLAAPLGTVSVAAAGDLLRIGDGKVSAVAVSLTSVAGQIGTLAAPVVVDAPAIEAGSVRTLTLDAAAAGDIHIRQATGDMLVGAITSARGAVQLTTNGSIYNADTWTIDPVAEDQRLAALMALGATDPNAYKSDVAAFERNVTSQYFLYWSLTNDGGDLSLWRLRTSVALDNTKPTDDQITAYVATLSAQVEAFFTQTIGPAWKSLPPFQSFDANYLYTATPEQVEGFRKDRTVTEARLALQLRARALDAPPPGEVIEGRVNITATSVQLASATGSVGMNDQPVTITAADFATGDLTPTQRQELALAAEPGDATLAPDGGVVLTVRRPIILAASGRVDVDAPGGIAIAQKSGSLLVGHVTSRDGLVSVLADGSILNAPNTITMWGKPLGFEHPEDWRLVGDAGQSLSSESGLSIPGYKQTASGTWFDQQVSTGSFRASFVYKADATSFPGDGLAFVLQKAGTGAVGEKGSGLGYQGIQGPKVGFLINIQSPWPTPPWEWHLYTGVLFDGNGTWTGGGFQQLTVPLIGQPVYVTLVYDDVAASMTVTVADRPGPLAYPTNWDTLTYRNVDLGALLGPSAFMGFTSGTGDSVTSQKVTDFSFASDVLLAGEHVALGDAYAPAWDLKSSTPGSGFTLATSDGKPTLTFPKQPNLAAAAWYPREVRVSTDFSITFRYRYDVAYGTVPGDGMALVFQNGPDRLPAPGAVGSGLGYTGIPGKKVGYLINIHPTNAGSPSRDGVGTLFNTTGSAGGPYNQFNIFPGEWFDVSLSYDATAKTLKELWTWTEQGLVIPMHEWITTDVDLPELLGGRTAIFGVTASSGESTAAQAIQSLEFTSPPVALDRNAADAWQLNGSVQRLANGNLVIPAVTNTATSSWFGRPVSTDGFTANFTYQAIKDPSLPFADGLAFVLQRSPAGFAAIGGIGGSLGYLGMPGPKVGFLMNIFGTPGVQFAKDSESGAFEPLPWLTGGPVEVTLVYNAEAKTFTATLTRTGFTPFVKTWTGIDLEAILGTQAIVGFTSGTGTDAATQIVSNFAFADRNGIASYQPVVDATPTVRLWSAQGDIGASGDEINVHGRLEADAPNGNIYTNPPPNRFVAVAATGVQLPAAGVYPAGIALDISVAFAEDVNVVGAPSLGVTIGGVVRQATFVASASTSRVLVFRFTTQPGDLALGGIVVASRFTASSAAMIVDRGGTAVDAALPSPSGTLVKVDTRPSDGPIAIGNALLGFQGAVPVLMRSAWGPTGLSFLPPVAVGLPESVTAATPPLAIDLDGNGLDDLVWRSGTNGVWAALATAAGGFSPPSAWGRLQPKVDWNSARKGDFNGDGRQDVIVRNPSTGNWRLLANTGTGFVSTIAATWSPSVAWSSIRRGDFNGDGILDVAGRDQQSGAMLVSLGGPAGFRTETWSTFAAGVTLGMVVAGDFTGDGRTDLAAFNPVSGNWRVLASTGSGFARPAVWASWPIGLPLSNVTVGDFNGDGRADLAGRDPATQRWKVSFAGVGGFSTIDVGGLSTPGEWGSFAVGDFNADGRTDIVARDATTGSWWLLAHVGAAFTTDILGSWSGGVAVSAARPLRIAFQRA